MAGVHSSRLRWMVLNAAIMALGLTLPMVFHAVGLGSKFLPMLLPLLVNGFLSPLGWAVFTGAATPLVSALLTGMPPLYPPVAAVMSVEGAVLGAVASLVYRATGRRVWPALIAAIVCGRLASAGLSWTVATALRPPRQALGGRLDVAGTARRRPPVGRRATSSEGLTDEEGTTVPRCLTSTREPTSTVWRANWDNLPKMDDSAREGAPLHRAERGRRAGPGPGRRMRHRHPAGGAP